MTGAGLLHHLFEDAVRRWPDRPAIEVPPSSRRSDRRVVAYQELKRQSDGLAHALRTFITGEDSIVAVLLPRASEHLYLSQLATLKAGGAFTCIDPLFPDAQVRTILDDAQPVVILTDEAGLARVRHLPARAPVVDVVEWAAQWRGDGALASEPAWLSPDSLAYLIYTSGTTGLPKGVMIEHRSIVNLVRGDLETLGVKPLDRVVQGSSPAYDSSIEETWFALAAGATLVAMDDEVARLGPDLVPWLRRERITMFCPAPTLLRATGCVHPQTELPELRMLHPGGEALSQDVADAWAPGRRLVNDYGPTEATVTALRGVIEAGQPVSIGRPVPGMQAWVLDEHLEEVPTDERGELCLGGIGLARGYRNEPELTALKFPVHPRLGRIYRTGDLASRDAGGNFYCHGRIDAQVKIRGYRIELEAIEARLIACGGIREAACTVQGEGTQKHLVAFVIPVDHALPPNGDDLSRELRSVLPDYMVPVQIGLLAQLPRNTSGKLNRQALPVLDVHRHEEGRALRPPRTAREEKLSFAFRRAVDVRESVSIDEDFFTDLGGDSLSAAMLVSMLRNDPDTASLTVRDLYETRTVEELAKRVRPPAEDREGDRTTLGGRTTRPASTRAGSTGHRPREAGNPLVATVVQALWLMASLMVAAPLAYVTWYWVVPDLVQGLGLVVLLLLTPAFYFGGLLIYAVVMVSMAVLAKRLLIGCYRPLRAPVWGSFYVRNWIVQRCVRLVPWRLLEATVFQQLALRAMGARIGQRVHLHRGVNLTLGGWDLLDIGDDVAIGQDAMLQLVTLEDGEIVVGRVVIDQGATLDVRSGVGANTHVGSNATLTAWSFLSPGGHIPAGEQWDGVPAQFAGASADRPVDVDRSHDLSPGAHGAALILARIAVGLFTAMPLQGVALACAWAAGLSTEGVVAWVLHPSVDVRVVLVDSLAVMGVVPLALLFQLFTMRLLGPVRPGAISRWSPAYLRVRLKTEILESAGRWLCGTLLWPIWLRGAGMTIGRGCEISTIIDTIPELVTIGDETFFADGVYLGGPRVSHSTVTLAAVLLDGNVFLGNHTVVGGGHRIPSDVLIGVCTVADSGTIRRGTSWFGHPPFELPRREVVEHDRALTHEPGWPRYLNRVAWEALRFAIPLVPVCVGVGWLWLLTIAEAEMSFPVLILVALPALEFGALALPTLFVLALKWILLGRVRPGVHPLWSCWCSRWDFLYVAWDFCASASLSAVEGTLFLNGYLRTMGMRLGRHVVLGQSFVHVVDPDMLEFEDGSTVTSLLQAHTFEDRVLKIDRIRVGREATVGAAALLLYGADVGARTHVAPHSVVMKRERLLPDRSYAGCPTRPVDNRFAQADRPAELVAAGGAD